ncbi:MAG: GntR family transcriptional regulator [Pseudomonadota bacterium]
MAHTFQPVKRAPLYIKVYQAIEADILSDRLPEHSALPTEADLSAQLGVTRSSVREGIRLLEQSGLVERGPGKRLIVKRPQTSEVAEAASKGMVRGGVTFREVWQALSAMYPSASALAAEHLSKEAVSELDQVVANLKDIPAKEHERVVENAVEFFQMIARGLDNRVLLTMLQSLNMLIEASLKQVIENTPKAKKRISVAQRNILGAIKAKDRDLAAEWMSKHINDLKRGYDVAGIDLNEQVM